MPRRIRNTMEISAREITRAVVDTLQNDESMSDKLGRKMGDTITRQGDSFRNIQGILVKNLEERVRRLESGR